MFAPIPPKAVSHTVPVCLLSCEVGIGSVGRDKNPVIHWGLLVRRSNVFSKLDAISRVPLPRLKNLARYSTWRLALYLYPLLVLASQTCDLWLPAITWYIASEHSSSAETITLSL